MAQSTCKVLKGFEKLQIGIFNTDQDRCIMKEAILTLWLAVALTSGFQTVCAYDQASIDRLRRSNTCAGCNFYRANFDGVNLTGANLQNTNLKYTKFRKATLYKANLTGADYRGANFEGALWIDGALCQKGSIGRCVRKAE